MKLNMFLLAIIWNLLILAESHNMKIMFDNDEYHEIENFYKIKGVCQKRQHKKSIC